MGALDQLAASINPFFRRYNTAKTFGVLVAATMIGGTVAITLSNYVCVTTKNVDKKFETNFGALFEQKFFADVARADPVDPVVVDKIARGVYRRTVESCTAYVGALESRPHPSGTGVNQWGAGLTQSEFMYCIHPPNAVIKAAGFPSHFDWCSKEQSEGHFKCPPKTGPGRWDWAGCGEYTPDMPGGWFEDPASGDYYSQHAGQEIDAETYYTKFVYNAVYPGWQCHYDALDPGKGHNLACPWFDPMGTKNPGKFGAQPYRYCGHGWGPILGRDATTWESYDKAPTGLQVPYFHGYKTIITTEEDVCSSLTGAIGSALAYISYIELVATLVIVSFFVGTGMAKTVTDEKTSILTVLKGAGIAEMEEKLEKIRLKEAEGKGDLTSSTGKVVQAVPMKDGKDTTQEV